MTATSFEASSGTSWTTYAQELAFVGGLVGPRLAKVPIGTTVQGRELYALRVGAATASRMPVVVQASIHGNEAAPREAALAFVRDMVASTDETTLAFLDRVPLYVIPCANPDGRVANSRLNANAKDLNRDFVALSQPESLAIAAFLRRLSPVAVADGHEIPDGSGIPEASNLDVGTGVNPLRSAPIQSATTAAEESIMAGLTALGISTQEHYWDAPGLTQLSGLAALGLPTVYTLMEANADTGTGTSGTAWQRYTWTRAAIGLWLDYMAANYETVADAVIAARAADSTKARTTKTWTTSAGGATVTATGYHLTSAQYATARSRIEALGFAHSPDATGENVWLTQPCAAQAVLMFDPNVAERILAATRLTTTPPRRRPGKL